MKAKDPYGDGYIDVSFPEGPQYTYYAKVCGDCGAVVGGTVRGPDLPVLDHSRAICPYCYDGIDGTKGRNIHLEEQKP